ncbi:lysophosphatidic acid receptor 5a [Clupea harengus]|uniref:Lysophosphatidic acid receptor 5a n=1 Tax=Clupea harengus TaxID=7950 RepID=A0A6P3VNA2_CLUHA|nr:lysophosphatidic acid receptor 5a [Clupea harengus]
MKDTDMSNGTCNISHFRYPLFTATYSLVLLVGLPLNAFSLWTLVRRLGLRSVPVIYMTNLALSDLLFTLSLPLRIIYFARGMWPFSNEACMIPGTLFSVNLYSSSFFITFISVDRMLAVVYPLRSRPWRTVSVSWTASVAVWVGIIGLSVPVALNHGANWDEHCSVRRCFENYPEAAWQNGFIILCILSVAGIFIPFGIIFSCTIAIIRKLRDQAPSTSESTSETMLNRSKMVRLFQINLFIYAVCFIPFHVAFVLYGLYKLKFLEYNFFDVQTVTMCLASTNSCLDPLIYYFGSKSIQRKRVDTAVLRTLGTGS